MRVKSSSIWLPVVLTTALCAGGRLPATGQLPFPSSTLQTAFDARALRLLDQMAAAYASLPGLDQHTEFYAASLPVIPLKAVRAPAQADGNGKAASQSAATAAAGSGGDSTPSDENRTASKAETEDTPAGEKLKRSLQLIALRPNHLRLELREAEPGATRDQITLWISDGKTFWTYADEKHYYTREAAPSKLHDFQKLNQLNTGSLELLMLIGVNPFAQVREQVDSVRYLGEAQVRGVQTEAVSLRAVQSNAITEARLYIGKADHLLYRLVTESVPQAAPDNVRGKVGDELDALVDGRAPATPPTNVSTAQFATSEAEAADPEPKAPAGPMKMVSSYDNIIKPLAKSYPSEFIFTIPEGALLYEPMHLRNGRYKQQKQNLADLFRMAHVKKKRSKPRVIKGE